MRLEFFWTSFRELDWKMPIFVRGSAKRPQTHGLQLYGGPLFHELRDRGDHVFTALPMALSSRQVAQQKRQDQQAQRVTQQVGFYDGSTMVVSTARHLRRMLFNVGFGLRHRRSGPTSRRWRRRPAPPRST